jgi:hypothetical protein
MEDNVSEWHKNDISAASLTFENSLAIIVFSLETSMMLNATLRPERGFVMTERRKRYSE